MELDLETLKGREIKEAINIANQNGFKAIFVKNIDTNLPSKFELRTVVLETEGNTVISAFIK